MIWASETTIAGETVANSAARALRALVSLPRILLLYPSEHKRIRSHVDAMHEILRGILDAAGGPIDLHVEGFDVLLNGRKVELPPAVSERFTSLLRQRNLEGLTIEPSVGADELRHLGHHLAADPRLVLRRLEGLPAPEMPHVSLRSRAREVVFAAQPGGRGTDERAIRTLVATALSRPGIARGVRRVTALLRTKVGETNVPEDFLESLIQRYLVERGQMPAVAIEQAMSAFLESLAETIETMDPDHGEAVQCVWELLCSAFDDSTDREVAPEPDVADESSVAYERFDPEQLGGWTALAWKALGTQIAEHDGSETAFLIHCELLAAAMSPAQFRERSRRIEAALRSGKYDAPAISRGLDLLRETLGHKDRNGMRFIRMLIPQTADRATLIELLKPLELTHWQDARELVESLSERSDGLELLAEILRAEVPRLIRREALRVLCILAKARPETWRSLVQDDPEILLHLPSLRDIMERSVELLGPATREVLRDGPDRIRRGLIANLRSIGTPRALRLLVLSLGHGRAPRDIEAIEALGAFSDPLAVVALREIVNRFNTGHAAAREADAAIRALRESAAADARGFLDEIASDVRWWGSVYRGRVRRQARRILSSKRGKTS